MAKAVRIRIKSGGKTHNSLESLLRNFYIKDILPLQDGHLARWLEQRDSEATKEIKELRKKTREELYDYSTALEFCRQFFLFSKDKKIADFVKNIEISRENLTKFISILLETDGYEKSAYGIWAYTLCPLSPKSFKKLARQAPQDVFSHLQDFSKKETKHQFVWKWLGICYKEGIGTPKNLNEAETCFEKVSADNWVKQQLEEIKKAISPQKKFPDVFREIEEFDLPLLRCNMGFSAHLILFDAIQKIYDACGTIDFPEIDKALRNFAKDASRDEIISAGDHSEVHAFIRNRFKGIVAEVKIKELSGSSITRDDVLQRIFPKNLSFALECEDARLCAYFAWWNHYKDCVITSELLARRAYELSPTITQEVISTLTAERLDTTPFQKVNVSEFIRFTELTAEKLDTTPFQRVSPPPCTATSFSEKNEDTSENQHAKDELVKDFFSSNIYNK